MASFGGSDIVAAIRLGFEIYENGFVEENRADVRYSNFQNEILNFSLLLRRLNTSLISAQQRFVERRRPVFGIKVHEPLSEEFENERKTIVGNFQKTLQDCESLLEKNKHFRDRDSNVIENLRYNLGKQEVQVDVLRRRLHFHSQKIRLVIDRLSLNLLTDLDDKVDDILAIGEQNLQVSKEIQLELAQFRASWLGYVSGNGIPAPSSAGIFAVSDAVAQKFGESLSLHGGDYKDGVPLSDGFDALLLHFEESSDDGSDQTPHGYLLFLKSRWLLQRIKEGQEYQRARPGFYYKRAINQIEQALSTRMAQPGKLIAYEDDILLELPDAHFQIWPIQEALLEVEYRKPDPSMIRGGEERLACLQLESDTLTNVDTITILKSSDEHFRIVHESTPNLTSGRTIVTGHNIYVKEDRLIPRYMFPTLQAPCLEFIVFCRNVEEYFRFKSLEELHRFQSALMGYEVSHQQERARCQFSDRKLDCIGQLQLWQEPIVLQTSSTEDEDVVPGGQTWQSPRSRSQNDSLTSSFAANSTIYTTREGWEADQIKTSSLVIFTQLVDVTSKAKKKPKRLAALSVVLDKGIHIDSRSCACRRDPDCKIVVLKNRKDVPFSIQYVVSELDSSGQPNPSTFDILPLRTPRHPEHERKVHRQTTDYVLLAFDTLAAKDTFVEELNLRFLVRDQQIEDQRAFERNLRYHQERPKKRQQSLQVSAVNVRQASFLASSSTSPSGGRNESRPRESVASMAASPKSDAVESTLRGSLAPRQDAVPVLPKIESSDLSHIFANIDLNKDLDVISSVPMAQTDSEVTVSTIDTANKRDQQNNKQSSKSSGWRKILSH